MDLFKVENFKKDFNTIEFPSFRALARHECEHYRSRLSLKLGLPADTQGRDLVIKISEINENSTVSDQGVENFNLKNVLTSIGYVSTQKVFVNWDCFNDVDEFNEVDLNRWFSYIWYPGSDDIDIFDETLDWVVSVYHFEVIRYIAIANSPGSMLDGLLPG